MKMQQCPIGNKKAGHKDLLNVNPNLIINNQLNIKLRKYIVLKYKFENCEFLIVQLVL